MPLQHATKKREKGGSITWLFIEEISNWETKAQIIANMEGTGRYEYRTRTAAGKRATIRLIDHRYLRTDAEDIKKDSIAELPIG